MSNITALMSDWRAGQPGAESALLKHVYPVIKQIAGRHLRNSKQFTLRPTELANDVFMQIRAGGENIGVENSKQFYALAARMVRFLIVDHIREARAQKRGSEFEVVELKFAENTAIDEHRAPTDWVALDQALTALEFEESSHAQLVELRFFMGLSIQEAASTIKVSTATAERMWRYARAFLAQKMSANP